MDQRRNDSQQDRRPEPTVSAVLTDGSIVELVYSDGPPQTALAVCEAWHIEARDVGESWWIKATCAVLAKQ